MLIHSNSAISSADLSSLNRALNIVFSGNYEDKGQAEVKDIIDDCLTDCAAKYYMGSVNKLIENELGVLVGIGPANPEHPCSSYRYVADEMLKFHKNGVSGS